MLQTNFTILSLNSKLFWQKYLLTNKSEIANLHRTKFLWTSNANIDVTPKKQQKNETIQIYFQHPVFYNFRLCIVKATVFLAKWWTKENVGSKSSWHFSSISTRLGFTVGETSRTELSFACVCCRYFFFVVRAKTKFTWSLSIHGRHSATDSLKTL